MSIEPDKVLLESDPDVVAFKNAARKFGLKKDGAVVFYLEGEGEFIAMPMEFLKGLGDKIDKLEAELQAKK